MDGCWCRKCKPVSLMNNRFVVCGICGNKRCPHADDCSNECSGSNETGQIPVKKITKEKS